MLLRLPQMSAGSPNMYCLTYRTLLCSAYEDAIGLPGKGLNFEPWGGSPNLLPKRKIYFTW